MKIVSDSYDFHLIGVAGVWIVTRILWPIFSLFYLKIKQMSIEILESKVNCMFHA